MYKLVDDEIIGDGTFGYVVAVTDDTGNRFAAKVFEVDEDTDESGSDDSSIEQCSLDVGVLREISILKACRESSHIVHVHDVVFPFADTNLPALIMTEYATDLRKAIKEGVSIRTVDVGYQLLSALRFMHTNGFLHRDIKPENVLLNKDGTEAALADFSLSKVYDYSPKAPRNTRSVGTTRYRAPEIIEREVYASAADCWAAGIVLIELFKGELNKEDGDCEVIMFLRDKLASLTPEQVDVVRPLVAVKASDRASADDAMQATLFGNRYEPLGRSIFKKVASEAKVDKKYKKLCKKLRADSPLTACAAQAYHAASGEDNRYCVMLAYKMYEAYALDVFDAMDTFKIEYVEEYEAAEMRILKSMNCDLYI